MKILLEANPDSDWFFWNKRSLNEERQLWIMSIRLTLKILIDVQKFGRIEGLAV
jgi:hypothetical protein